jgi:hypothetical protein
MIDLQPFCYPEHWLLDKPWVKEGFRCATNGHLAIRVPAPGEPDTKGERPLPSLGPIVLPPPAGVALNAFPATPEIAGGMVTCPDCEGGLCPTCRQKCPTCRGDALVHKEGRTVRLAERTHVAVAYYKLLRALPGCQWHQPAPNKPIYFRFDGGDGVVMPHREPEAV